MHHIDAEAGDSPFKKKVKKNSPHMIIQELLPKMQFFGG
jgi:hypothetical protein